VRYKEPMLTPARSTLRASGLECVRGERRLFAGLAFELANGGLLQVGGPNGSGKSSLLRMVCGLLPPAAGEITWNGSGVRGPGDAYRASLAYVGHLNAIKDELDAGENLRLAARVAGLSTAAADIAQALDWFGLEAHRRLPCKLLSQGQKRRLALARLKLSAARALWVLDEPFAALDADAIAATRSLLEAHLAGGGLALLTTHQETAIAAPAAQRIELGR
jgi:heme exporter protein A